MQKGRKSQWQGASSDPNPHKTSRNMARYPSLRTSSGELKAALKGKGQGLRRPSQHSLRTNYKARAPSACGLKHACPQHSSQLLPCSVLWHFQAYTDSPMVDSPREGGTECPLCSKMTQRRVLRRLCSSQGLSQGNLRVVESGLPCLFTSEVCCFLALLVRTASNLRVHTLSRSTDS